MLVGSNRTYWRRRLRYVTLALMSLVAAFSAQAQTNTPENSQIIRITSTTELPMTRNLTLGVGRALILELPVDAQDTVISDPATLDASVLTPRRIMLFAKQAGLSNVFVLGRDGRRLLILDITARKDFSDLAKMLQQVLPGSRIRVQPSGAGVVLSGTVANPVDSARAGEIAAQHLGKDTVVNLITTSAKEQVLLKVAVAELQRDALRRIGVNMPEALAKAGSFTFAKVIANGFPVTGASAPAALFTGAGRLPEIGSGSVLQGTASWNGNSVSAMLDAFERVGLARTLAEPTLVAMSGEPAKFHAGGEMPVPVAQQNNTISVAWKPFGVSIAFTPYVLAEGRISLKVSAEVSELSNQGAVVSQGLSIPAIQLRKAETVVEMASGSALAMAGLLSEQTRRNTDGVPELQNLPILGALFRSKDYRNSQSELVIMVTPYIVKPTEAKDVVKPNDGKLPVTPLRTMLLSHLNRVYSHVPADAVRGGYIVAQPSVKD
jgi:pilus assembly protein CpaC